MLIHVEGLVFIKDYIEAINDYIKRKNSSSGFTRLQRVWLRFVLLGMLVTNSLCWKRFERSSLGKYKSSAICWMFRKAKICWELILQGSVLHILKNYGIKSGMLVIDDTDIERSKNTVEIAKVHKIKNKKTGGFFNGQNIVFLLLVSDELTIPVGFKFYEPDPEQRKWRIENARLLKKGVTKKYRPEKPKRNPDYPDKKSLALRLIKEFTSYSPNIKIKTVVADSFYGKRDFINEVVELTKAQVISQISRTQLINVNGKNVCVKDFFNDYKGKTEEVFLRGKHKKISYCSGKFKVKAHNEKYFIIALKYEGETEYRYLIAKNMTWRDIDIIKAYAYRWLVEVFIQDWKTYEGWTNLAKQRGFVGSDRGLTLSLLCDHMLHFHNSQLTSFKNKQKALTVGSLREKVLIESIMAFIEKIVKNDNPQVLIDELNSSLSNLFGTNISTKHLRNFNNEKELCMA